MSDEQRPINGARLSKLGIAAVLVLVGMFLATAVIFADMGKDGLAEMVLNILSALGGA